MQIVDASRGVFTVSLQTLENIPIEDNKALFVEHKDVANMRSLISYAHKKTNMRFETQKADGGMNVWRKNDIEAA